MVNVNPDWKNDMETDPAETNEPRGIVEAADTEDKPLYCPSCHSDNLKDKNNVFEDEHCIGTQFACLDCGHHWVDDYNRDWENYQ